ncbi:MAG: CRTAC1 family protein [Myxococcota bacterium]
MTNRPFTSQLDRSSGRRRVLWVGSTLALGGWLAAGCGPNAWVLPRPNHDPVPTPAGEPRLVSARVEAGAPRTCAAPAARDLAGPFEVRTDAGPTASVASLWSSGIMAGDLDQDGLLDLVTPFEPFSSLYRGREGARMERFDDRLGGFDLEMGTGGSLADADGDGDLDLLILRYEFPAVLLRNRGDGTFDDVTGESGLDADGPSTSSSWGDLDADGDLDLFVGAYGDLEGEHPARARLFENRGDGTFLDRSDDLAAVLGDGFTRVGGFHDLDGDGLPELYVVNDVGSVQPNVLLRNVDGALVRDDNASGLDLQMSGGGLGVGDVNGDDVPDFLIPQWAEMSLMLSNGAGQWFDSAATRDLRPNESRGQRVGWGAELADLDNDGDLDGMVAYGAFDVDIPYWENPEHQPDALFLQGSDGTFTDVAPAWGVDDLGKNRGFVVADFNDDGWLDLVTRNVDGPSRLYVSRCGAEHWVKVALHDPAIANASAVGARVRVIGESGRHWTRWLTAGGTGYGTGGPPELHFGLGAERSIERVEVRWPDGSESWVGFGQGVDRRLTVVREP